MKEGTERAVAQKRGIWTQMLAEAEAPCAEQAGGAQWFLSKLSVLALSHLFLAGVLG